MRDEIAVLIAAGKGERMRPITEDCPKPLVKVHGKPMIETVIEALRRRAVSRIYVVTGYLAETFDYLNKKYDNVSLIYNTDYSFMNNISSIYAVRNVIGEKDCFVCEADIVVFDPAIFDGVFKSSCYYGKMVHGYSEDWIFEQDNSGRITHIGKGGTDQYNMCGVCYLKAKDAKIVRDAVVDIYQQKGKFEQMYWDEIVDQEIKNIYMTVRPVTNKQIIEIDTVAELKIVDTDYQTYA